MMTLREKLADWLTGGGYGRYRSGEAWASEYTRAKHNEGCYRNALQSIASIPVTRNSNGQTRKAVRIAKEALE